MSASGNKAIVGYIRVSTDEQAREGVSLDAQAESVRAFAKSQGWDLSAVYRDDFTGTTLDRPGLRRLMERIESGKVGTVLVYKLDRLARSQRLVLHILEEIFDRAGVRFKSVTEPFETDSAMGKAFLGILAVFSQLERDTIAERTKHALTYKRSLGEHVGRVPFGYRIGGKGKLERHPEQQKTIARIRRLHREGKSVRDISGRVGVCKSTIQDIVSDSQTARNAKYVNGLRRAGVR